MTQLLKRFVIGLALLPLLASCGHTPVTRTVAAAFAGSEEVDTARLDPNLRYLRVTVGGRTALMVLGYAEPAIEGEIQTWYSSAGELLKIQNGRIIATAGLETDWRSVRYVAVPAWGAVTRSQPVKFQRIRDEMPGYRFNIANTLLISPIAPPTDSRITGIPVTRLRWFEERELNPSSEAQSVRGSARPPVRYALRHGSPDVVVYGEQCLSEKLCLAWQTWPVSQ